MYANGSATSPIDAGQQLVVFLAAAGWTTDSNVTEGAGFRAHLHKSGNYVHIRAAMSEQPWQYGAAAGYSINLYTGTGFNGGQPWNNQVAGAPVANGTSAPVGVGMP